MRVLRFVRLPLVLLVVWTALRFMLGPVFNVPYAPRGNAMVSVFGLTIISALIYGAMSNRVGNFSWLGTLLIGLVLGLFSQILIFTATLVSYLANISTYFIHWDALNMPPGTPEGTVMPMAQAMTSRAVGLLVGPILIIVIALIGRAVFARLAPHRSNDGAD